MNAGRSLTRSSHSFVGCLVSAAVRALPSATSGEVGPAPSNRSSRYGTPASSTIAIDTFHLFFSASALQAAIILWASSVVRQGLVRMWSPDENAISRLDFSVSSEGLSAIVAQQLCSAVPTAMTAARACDRLRELSFDR